MKRKLESAISAASNHPKHDEPTVLEQKDMCVFIDRLSRSIDVGGRETSLRGLQILDKYYSVLEHFSCGDRDVATADIQRSMKRLWVYVYSVRLIIDHVEVPTRDQVAVNGFTGRASDIWKNDPYTSLVFTVCPVFYFPEDLIDAVTSKNLSLVTRIVESGVSVNSRVADCRSALDIAVRNDDRSMLYYLLQHPSIDVTASSNDGTSFLQRNIAQLRIPILSMILASTVDLHAQDGRGRNIVHTMAANFSPYEYSEMEMILESGSDILTLCTDMDGKVPWDLIVCNAIRDIMPLMCMARERAFSAVYAQLCEHTHMLAPELIQIVMKYYTKSL
jgi:hypothetical protein